MGKNVKRIFCDLAVSYVEKATTNAHCILDHSSGSMIASFLYSNAPFPILCVSLKITCSIQIFSFEKSTLLSPQLQTKITAMEWVM